MALDFIELEGPRDILLELCHVNIISIPLRFPHSVRLLSYKAMKPHKRGLESLLSNGTKLIFKSTSLIFYILAAKFLSQWN